MAFDLGGIWIYIKEWVINPAFWFLILVFFIGVAFMALWIRKKRNLIFEAIEITEFGINTKSNKCGWFGEKSYLGGLWWSGKEVMKTNFNEIILEFSEEDFIELNKKRGVIFYRDPIKRLLFPINKIGVKNKEFVATVPPADFIEAALDIIREADKETTDWKDKLIQFAGWALVVIFSLVAIIVIVQMVKNGQDKAAELLTSSSANCLEAAKSICTNVATTIKGTSGSVAP